MDPSFLRPLSASPTEDAMEVRKRVDEIRILESRKSSRLVDQDKDFARIADIGLSGAKATDIALAGIKSAASALAAVTSPFSASLPAALPTTGPGRKRSVSNCIDVPHSFIKAQRRR